MGQYLPIFAMIVLAIVFALLSIVASRLLNPSKATPAKVAPYECGIIPSREPPERFPVRFYLIAMIFIVFDIELIFIYPWAVINEELGSFGLLAMVLFAALVFESFVYLIGNGALDWGPAKIRLRDAGMVTPTRTASSTIRRVGTEGREPSRPLDAGTAA